MASSVLVRAPAVVRAVELDRETAGPASGSRPRSRSACVFTSGSGSPRCSSAARNRSSPRLRAPALPRRVQSRSPGRGARGGGGRSRAHAARVDGGQIKQVAELGLVNDVRELPLGELVGEVDEQACDRRDRDALVDGHVARVAGARTGARATGRRRSRWRRRDDDVDEGDAVAPDLVSASRTRSGSAPRLDRRRTPRPANAPPARARCARRRTRLAPSGATAPRFTRSVIALAARARPRAAARSVTSPYCARRELATGVRRETCLWGKVLDSPPERRADGTRGSTRVRYESGATLFQFTRMDVLIDADTIRSPELRHEIPPGSSIRSCTESTTGSRSRSCPRSTRRRSRTLARTCTSST